VAVAVTSAETRRFHPLSLDAVNFFLADVRGALGPYLNVFLVTHQHWSQAETGFVTTIGGLLGLAAQTPIGAAIDETRAKRGVIILALAALALGAVTIFVWPSFWPVLVANSLIAVVGDVFGPAVAALTLGLYARKHLARRMGRNSALDHAGNVVIALMAGAIGYAFSQRAVFLLVPVFAVLAGLAVLSIPSKAIDQNRARDLDGEAAGDKHNTAPAGYAVLLKIRPLVIFGLCVMLFHFANAPLLPLVGQKLAAAYPQEATVMISACIIAAQLVMLPIALMVGRTADTWGRKPILLIGFGILPLRAALYTLSDNTAWLIGVQLLDGIGAGVFGAITPLLLADLMHGTGRYNVAQGAVATLQGVGASTSGLVAGLIVDNFGYSPAFLALSAVAAVAFAALAIAMPETALDLGRQNSAARTAR
jgi:MFS family permease